MIPNSSFFRGEPEPVIASLSLMVTVSEPKRYKLRRRFHVPFEREFRMRTVIEEVEAFREFVLEQFRGEAADLSLEDLLGRWRALRPVTREFEQSLQSLARGLDDAKAGRVVDADHAVHETRFRLQNSKYIDSFLFESG